MKKRLATVAIATTAAACAMLISVDFSGQSGASLSVQSAEARIGRPLTPMSAAGVARRHYRRAAYGYGYGYGAVGAGLAVGAATVAAETSPWAYASDQYAGGLYAESPWGYYECRLPHIYPCQPYSHVGWYH